MSPLDAISRWRAAESALESAIPLTLAGTAWTLAVRLLASPSNGRPATDVELLVVLGAAVAVTAWATARHLVLFRFRNPRVIALWSLGTTAGSVWTARIVVRYRFAGTCTDDLGGKLTTHFDLFGAQAIDRACVWGEIAGNAYLPGTIVVPGWTGTMPLWMTATLGVVAIVAGHGLRETRLRRTRIGSKLFNLLMLAPAKGAATVIGGLTPDADVQACGNPTMWGELCGQVYDAEREFQPGEWCPRCQQPFRPATRKIRLDVVSIATGDIDVLNGMERIGTDSWTIGDPMRRPRRPGGRARWVKVGVVELPDVITVAQALALVHERIPTWKGEGGEAAKRACELAEMRASRVCAWLWFGRVSDKLNHARPTRDVRFAVGPTRLRDLIPDAGEQVTLQLDAGLLPLELRVAFHFAYGDEEQPDRLENSRMDLWVPVAPPPHEDAQLGLWVDRIEGEALLSWLSTGRVRADAVAGVATPLGYVPRSGGVDASAVPLRPQGRLDYIRQPLDDDSEEPIPPTLPGVSMSEWDWFEGEQIELLRREVLVQVDTGRGAFERRAARDGDEPTGSPTAEDAGAAGVPRANGTEETR